MRAGLGDISHDCLWTGPDAAGPPTLRALCERLLATRYTLLHVVCHGVFSKADGETAILLAGDDGQVERVEAARLLAQLRALGGPRGLPHFAFLATCESADPRAEGALGGLAQRLVRDLGMPAVIAMTEKISQTTALALGRAFYPRLREHGEVDRALVEALALVGERFDSAVPALFSRLGGRPLFSDDAGRPATATELRRALEALTAMMPVRAPILAPRLAASIEGLAPLLDVDPEDLAPATRRERADRLEQIDALCEEVADVSLTALALGKPAPGYDATCPFPGLRSFGQDDRRFFFGRDALVARLERELLAAPLLAVLGQSGSGKSSAAMAGLVPRLQRARPGLVAVTMVPGSSPRARLEKALAGAGLAEALERARATRARRRGRSPLLAEGAPDPGLSAVLVVDQLEEAFTLCDDAGERAEFFELLLSLTREIFVVVTLRADFLGEVAPHAELRAAIERRQVLVPPMTPPEIRAAIEQQAAAVGLRFEGDLIATVLGDVEAEPGAMPLLQHALLELWRRRHGRWLRADEYRALGGVSRAIAETADAIVLALEPADRARVRRIFTRLTRVDVEAGGGDRRDTRRRVEVVDLVPTGEDPAATTRLIARLAGDRLLVTATSPTTGRETVEVSHEALIRRWPRLQEWIAEDIEGIRKIGQLSEAARSWDEAGGDSGHLAHRDARLRDIEELVATGRFALNQREADYLAACVALRERVQAEEEAARTRELEQARAVAEAQRQRAEVQEAAAKAIRRRARVIAAVGALALIAAIASALLYRRSEAALADARESRQIAEKEQKKAEEGEARARDALLVSTADRIDGDATRQALVLREVGSLGEDPRWDQHLFRSASEARAISGFDEDRLVEPDYHAPGSPLALDAAGERLLTVAPGGTATLRAVAGPSVRWTAALGESRAGPLFAAGRGALSLGLDSLSYVPLIDAVTPADEPPVIDIRASRLHDVVVHDGRTRALISVSEAGPSPACDLAVVEVDTATLTAETRCVRADAEFTAAVLLPGPDAALIHASGRFAVIPLSGGPALAEQVSAFRSIVIRESSTSSSGQPGLEALVRNADGTRVALGGWTLPPVPGQRPTGATDLVLDDDSQLRQQVELWRIDAAAPPTRVDVHELGRAAARIVFDGDEPLVVEGGAVWTREGGSWSLVATIPSADRATEQPLLFDPATRTLALGNGASVVLFEAGPRRVRELHGHNTGVRALAFSADGRRLASADATTVRVWDTTTAAGERVWRLPALRIFDVARDGRRVMIGEAGPDTDDGDALIVAVDDPDPPRRIAGEVMDARFLPDGVTAVARMVAGDELVLGVSRPDGGLLRITPEEAWRADLVFGEPAQSFLEPLRGVAWGLGRDGRGWQAQPPGAEVDALLFASTGQWALLLAQARQLDRMALVARSGEITELLGAAPLPGESRVHAATWSPDGARIAAVYFTEDGACAVHWAPDAPAGARRNCVRAAEVPGGAAALHEPRRGLAWSRDGSLLACTLGEGNILIPTGGDAPPRWLGSGSRREETALRFDPGGELLIESTRRGVYVWSVDGDADAPVTLVEYDPGAVPIALREVPVADGLVTVALTSALSVRRWKLARGPAKASLSDESPFCLDPAWRRSVLHETADEARYRSCECQRRTRAEESSCP